MAVEEETVGKKKHSEKYLKNVEKAKSQIKEAEAGMK